MAILRGVTLASLCRRCDAVPEAVAAAVYERLSTFVGRTQPDPGQLQDRTEELKLRISVTISGTVRFDVPRP
jgi:hypothetical protein